MSRNLSILVICVLLVLSTVGVYWPIHNHDFINYDDPDYVTENSHIKAGFTGETLIWAFSTFHASNWHPVTWLSHMLDYQLYGDDPAGHHLTNLFFHLCNTLLLFMVLQRMTSALWQSGLVAVLFALHPLHVQSVAWVAERKDVLSTLFWMLTMWTYIRYTEKSCTLRYLLVFLCFALGLMSKPMLVTLPIVLLLLDFWPLGRFQLKELGYLKQKKKGADKNRNIEISIRRLFFEKAPFFGLAVGSCILTYFAQKSGGAIDSLESLSLDTRLINALVSYYGYIEKMLWPENLAFFYPHPGNSLAMVGGVLGGLFLLGMCFFTIRIAGSFPYVTVGWFWYVITLLPVIGLIQVGGQAMADRYTYVPIIGIFILLAWGIPDVMPNWRYKKEGLWILSCIVLIMCIIKTSGELDYWKNSKTLFERAIKVTEGNYIAHNNLGYTMETERPSKEAIDHYREAIRINPNFAKAHGNLGVALLKQEKHDEAMLHFLETLRIDPENALAHAHLGNVFVQGGEIGKGIEHLVKAIRIDPTQEEAHFNLGVALFTQGKYQEAIPHFEKAIRMSSDEPLTYAYLGLSLAQVGKFKEGKKYLLEALRRDPTVEKVHYYLGIFQSLQGSYEEAVVQYSEALRINPDYADAHYSMGQAMSYLGKDEEAALHFLEVVRISPQDSEAHNNLGVTLVKTGKVKEAVAHFSKAVEINPHFENAKNNLNYALQFQILEEQ